MIRRNVENEIQRRAVLASIQNFPLPFSSAVGQPIKSRDQEAKYHAILSEIAEQAQHVGSKWDTESWKRFTVESFVKEWNAICDPDDDITSGRVVPNLTGDGVVVLGAQTRNFTRKQGSGFIEFLQKWCAENGVELSE